MPEIMTYVSIDDYEYYSLFSVDEIYNAMSEDELSEMYDRLIVNGYGDENENRSASPQPNQNYDLYVPSDDHIENALHVISNMTDEMIEGLPDEEVDMIQTKFGNKGLTSSPLINELKVMVNMTDSVPTSSAFYYELKSIINSL